MGVIFMSLDKTVQNNESPSNISTQNHNNSRTIGRLMMLGASLALLYLGTAVGCAPKPATKINKSYEIKDQFITSAGLHPIENFIYVNDNKIASTVTNYGKNMMLIKYDAKDKNIITLDSISNEITTINFENLTYWTVHLTPDAKYNSQSTIQTKKGN